MSVAVLSWGGGNFFGRISGSLIEVPRVIFSGLVICGFSCIRDSMGTL